MRSVSILTSVSHTKQGAVKNTLGTLSSSDLLSGTLISTLFIPGRNGISCHENDI